MEQSQNSKVISFIIVIVLVLGVIYLVFGTKDNSTQVGLPTTGSVNTESEIVVVENTAPVNGVLPVPAGFPGDIPLEGGVLVESSTTHYPGQDARQLFVSYRSPLTVAQKYAEYQEYLTESGYHLTAGIIDSGGESTFSGTKGNATLAVVLTSGEGATLVKLSYLMRSISQ